MWGEGGLALPEPPVSAHTDHAAKWGSRMTSEHSQQDQNPRSNHGSGEGFSPRGGCGSDVGSSSPASVHRLKPCPARRPPMTPGAAPPGPSHSSPAPNPSHFGPSGPPGRPLGQAPRALSPTHVVDLLLILPAVPAVIHLGENLLGEAGHPAIAVLVPGGQACHPPGRPGVDAHGGP